MVVKLLFKVSILNPKRMFNSFKKFFCLSYVTSVSMDGKWKMLQNV